ncbi:MAG: EamA family transporter [Candidatus Thiodiazotropha sp. (ex Lucinoma borealis)]|nr:EamA family transporter [Candidatus Thiodiazotropha sp. (ex Troendleina suluensis)]MCU7866547.1 EamA family transporter [Candidatus Thiodiazotropha sp. (ex Lucinoma borealis)]MCU7946757.1 EamA family transporter [Candidatus Thiodiazotropha sp. (ex Cardiolucina cf. quadrata)]
MNNTIAHVFAIATPLLASISQIIVKWQVNQVKSLPDGIYDKFWFLLEFLVRPWVMFSMLATFLGGVTWIIAMTKLDISYAYPYVAASFIIVPALAVLFFGEHVTIGKIVGSTLILSGIAVVMIKG